MWLLITIIKLPVRALAGTEAVTILRWLVEGFSRIPGAICHLAGLGCDGSGMCVCVCVCVWDSSWSPNSSQESLGSKVKAEPSIMPMSFIEYSLNTYYVLGLIPFSPKVNLGIL